MSRKVSPYLIQETDQIALERRICSRNIIRKEVDGAYIIIESSKGRLPFKVDKELNKVLFLCRGHQSKGFSGQA